MQIFNYFEFGKKLNYSYLNLNPFPSIILDNFINSKVALTCHKELTEFIYWGYDPTEYSKKHQVNKYFVPWSNGVITVDNTIEFIKDYMPSVHSTLQCFNSQPFLNFLEDLTSIKGLVGDPTFAGGGAHKISKGGKLSLHLDYNIHPETKYFRVINLLLYLNPVWEKEWGGDLELWDFDKKTCFQKIQPIFNRATIFTLSDKSIHGHPHPLNCPENISRYSLALYYFTKIPNQSFSERFAAQWYEF